VIDVKPEIVRALGSNQALISLLGGPRIYQLVAPIPEELPRITLFEMVNADNWFADDTAYASKIHIQVDVWSKESTTAIAAEVDKTMKSIGFQRYASADLYENDTKIFHKALRFSTNKFIEEGE